MKDNAEVIETDTVPQNTAIAGRIFGKAGNAGPVKMKEVNKNRAVRRMKKRYNNPGANKSHARISGAKLTKSPAQWAIEFRAAQRAELSKIKLAKVLSECPELKFVAGVPGLRTVWQLSQASNATIGAIPGLGPVRRQRIRAYLVGKGITVVWTA